MHDEKIDWDEYYGGPSRSTDKRDALDVLALAKELAALSGTRTRPRAAQRRPARPGAGSEAHHRERCAQAPGAVSRETDAQARRRTAGHPRALEAPKVERRRAASALHRIEEWRDRLLRDGDDAINDLLAALPNADRQQLRQLVRTAKAEAAADKPPAAARRCSE